MTVTINGSSGITTPEVTLDNTAADGGQVVLKSSGYSNWNLDNYSGRFRGYYGSTEYFTVDASGNMGIGTSSPSVKLQTYGTTANFCGLQAETTSANAYIRLKDSTKAFTVGSNSGNLTFYDDTSGAERMRIDSSGNLLVGTTSSLGGTARLNVSYNFTNDGARWKSDSTSNHNAIVFMNPNGDVGAIRTNGSATTYNTSSDYRLKENIAPMTGALSVVAALKPCTYTWKVDGAAGQGFIAHELQAVVPDCVSGEKDAVDADGNPVYQGIDTSFLVATLTAAIQEQQTLIQDQLALINSLTARIEALENK